MASASEHGRSVAESYPAVPDSVPRARGAIVRLARELGASGDTLEAIRLATSEALTNAVLHAYDGSPGEVHVAARPGPGTLLVTVADDGAGLRPRLDRHGMGIGLALIAEAARELTIVKRPAGGTELRMHFAL
jgi:stage II sporulation protein AB (anti-sigma F factor)